jgi:lipopolysaccharide/colanic/teichoic acid biosynthesis glycosyltransferase
VKNRETIVMYELSPKNVTTEHFCPKNINYVANNTHIIDTKALPNNKLTIEDSALTFWYNQYLKRSLDILFSVSVLLLLASWLFPMIALLTKLTSKGSVFFVQQRVGYQGRIFNCYKFRSMVINSTSDAAQTAINDSRITKFGSFIRKSNIDELPQFFNVLLGDMSVIGPRPHPVFLDTHIAKELPNYVLRYHAKPGVSGWAQVHGCRGPMQTKQEKLDRINYDIWYIQNWSLFLDIKTIFLTIFGSKTQENAF